VKCRVTKRIHRYLNADTRVELGTIGMLGDKYIEVVPGTKGSQADRTRRGDRQRKRRLGPKMFEAGEKAFNSAGKVVTGLDTLLVRMNRGEGTLANWRPTTHCMFS